MKKYFILFLCITLSNAMLFAQKLTIMPKIGASISNVSISDELLGDDDKPKVKIGITSGVGLEIQVNKWFAVQPELLFSQKGFRTEFSEDGFESKSKNTLNYLELPILAKFKFDIFYANIGPYVAYGLGGNYSSEASFQGDTMEESGKIKFGEMPDNYNGDNVYVDNAFDFGMLAGAGVKLGPVVLDLRYGLGFTNLFDDIEDVDDEKFKNRTFQFTVGVPIALKK
jgi:hypothetical protein